jgi:hypothetical protein
MPALVRLRTSALALESAGALRLLDRALAAHGRNHGYLTDAWCQHAHVAAHLAIHAPEREGALGARVDDAALALGRVVGGLHRDRFAVPEDLADAIGALLVVYLAGRPT